MTRARNIADIGDDVAGGGSLVTTSSPSLGRRNLIINGAMQVAQRGTSATGVTGNGYFSTDRWKFTHSSDAVYSIENVADSPDGFSNSTKVTVTTADTSIASTQYSILTQYLEAQNLQQLKWGTSSAESITLSFWVKSSTVDTFAISLQHGENSDYISKQYTVNASNTWEYKTLTFVGNQNAVINNDNGVGLYLYFMLAAGSTYNTGASDTWTGVGALGGGIDNTWIGTTNATFQITGVQLEVGSVSTPYEHRSYGEELALCQRYYEKSYSQGTAPGTATDTGRVLSMFGNTTSGFVGGYITFTSTKRSNPTVTIFAPSNGSSGNAAYYVFGSSTTTTTLNPSQVCDRGTAFYASGTNCDAIALHYTADAEL